MFKKPARGTQLGAAYGALAYLAISRFAPAARADLSYAMQPLGNLGGVTAAVGLNDQGQAIGEAFLPDGSYHAFLWSPASGLVDLGAPPGFLDTAANGINNTGQIVGNSQSQGSSTVEGFLWQQQTGMVDLGSGTGLTLEVTGVNNQGQIYGSARTSPDQPGYGFVYTSTSGVTALSIPGVPVDSVLAINNNGQMLLSSPSYSTSLFYAPGQTPVPIQGAGLTQATALAINDSGTVVGLAEASEGTGEQAFIWTQSSGMIDLTPGAGQGGIAYAINSAGDVVGVEGTDGEGSNAFLNEGGAMYDLDTLLGASAAGWSDLYPQAINDEGQIVGYGTFDGQTEAFLLNPSVSPSVVPEPASLGVLALGAFALLRRRRVAAAA